MYLRNNTKPNLSSHELYNIRHAFERADHRVFDRLLIVLTLCFTFNWKIDHLCVDVEKKLYNFCINPKKIDACGQLSAEDIVRNKQAD